MARTRKFTVKLIGDSSSVERAFGRAGGAGQTMGSKFAAVGANVARAGAAIGAAGVVGVGVAKNFADAASDLGEAQAKANVIFGEYDDIVSSFAANAAATAGMSKAAATGFVSDLGQVFKATGAGQKDLAEYGATVTQLAGDLASFNNLDTGEVANALRAGLGGEAEPLKRLGIFMSAAAVEAKALEMGLGGVGGELTEGEKIQARYAIIMEQTADAQGDFVRTSDGMANSQRRMSAEWENLQAQLGEKLAPIFADVFSWVADKLPTAIDTLGPKLQQFGAWFQENIIPPLQKTKQVIEDWIEAVKAFWSVFGDDIIAVLRGVFEQLKAEFEFAFTAVSETLKIFKAIFTGDWSQIWESLGAIFTAAWELVKSSIGNSLTLLKDLFADKATAAKDAFIEKVGELWEWVKTDMPGDVTAAFANLGVILSDKGAWLMGKIWAGIKLAWPIVLDWFKGLPAKILTGLIAVADALKTSGWYVAQKLWDGIKALWPSIAAWVADKARGLGESLYNALTIDLPGIDVGNPFASSGSDGVTSHSRPASTIGMDLTSGGGSNTFGIGGGAAGNSVIVNQTINSSDPKTIAQGVANAVADYGGGTFIARPVP